MKNNLNLSNENLKEILEKETKVLWNFKIEHHPMGFCNADSPTHWLCFTPAENHPENCSGFDFVIFSGKVKNEKLYTDALQSINWFDVFHRTIKTPTENCEVKLFGRYCTNLKKIISKEFKKQTKNEKTLEEK